MTRYFEEKEIVQFRHKKNKSTMLYIVIYFPIWLYLTSLFLLPLYRSVFLGETVFTPLEYYLLGMIGLTIFIPGLVFILLSYCLNKITITDESICIRRGVTGKTQILDMRAIRSFEHVVSTGKRHSNRKIYFYLRCGKIVKTPDLYIRADSRQAMLELLHEKFEDRGFTLEEMKEIAQQNTGSAQPVKKTNFLIWLIVYAPFVLALILTVSYLVKILT